jgi:hypothetical protein
LRHHAISKLKFFDATLSAMGSTTSLVEMAVSPFGATIAAAMHGIERKQVRIIGKPGSGRSWLHNLIGNEPMNPYKPTQYVVCEEEAQLLAAIQARETSLIFVVRPDQLEGAAGDIIWIVERLKPHPNRKLLILITHADQSAGWPGVCTTEPVATAFGPHFGAALTFAQAEIHDFKIAICSLQAEIGDVMTHMGLKGPMSWLFKVLSVS